MICFFIYKQDCKPGYVFQMIIYLEQLLPAASSNLPKTNGPHYRLASVLLQMGFTKPNGLPPAGALLPHLSTLTVIHGGFLFYGTFPRVAPAGCYPASRPAKLGLSSRLSARNHLSCSRVTVYHPVYLISTFYTQ